MLFRSLNLYITLDNLDISTILSLPTHKQNVFSFICVFFNFFHPEKTIIQKDTCTPVFIAALFTITRTWEQPKCPLTDERIKKMWHIYKMEYYSAIKRNEIELFVVRWMDIESVIQSEVSQKEKNTVC